MRDRRTPQRRSLSFIHARQRQYWHPNAALGKAMATGALMKVKSVRRDHHSADETCAVHCAEVCLSLADVM